MALFQKLEVDGFRNLRSVKLLPHPKLNFIAGANGAGKTAILEAVHYLVRGKSFRSVQPQELVGHQSEQMLIRAGVQLEGLESQVVEAAVLRQRHRRQQIRWRGEATPGFARISGHVPLQVFLPSLSDLVFGGPAERRRWMDWGAFHVEQRYLEHWRRFSKALQQRNALLRRNIDATTSQTQTSERQAFTEALLEQAEAVTRIRQAYLDRWLGFFERRLEQLIAEGALPSQPRVVFKPYGSSKSLSLQELLVESGPRELKSGVTVYGPHRADLDLLLDTALVSSTASRGQGKLIALSMMLAQADVIADRTGASSVFLMDDLDAELDAHSRERLYAALGDCQAQVFITGVQAGPEAENVRSAPLPNSYAMFHVEHGSVTQETV